MTFEKHLGNDGASQVAIVEETRGAGVYLRQVCIQHVGGVAGG